MATEPHSIRRDAWNTAYSHYLSLNQQLDQAPPAERDALERAMAAQQDTLLDMSAPTFLAVMHKLEMLWEGQFEGLDQESEEKLLIIADLSELCAAGAALMGYSSPFGARP
jgi:hypothetical protein